MLPRDPDRQTHQHRLEQALRRLARLLHPAHHRRRRHPPHTGVVDGRRPAFGRARDRRQRGDGPVGEDVLGSEDQPRGEGPRHQLYDRDRVAAEIEEPLIDADALPSQNLAEQVGQQLLTGSARRAGRRLGGVSGRGQGTPVEFAIGGQRQGVEDDHLHGHQVVWELCGDVVAQLKGVGAAGAWGGDRVGHQPSDAGTVLTHHRRRVCERRVPGQRGRRLTRLDPIPVDLGLVVGAAEEHQLAVLGPARQVARAVHPGARRAERIGEEALRRHSGPVQIAARQTGTGDVEVTGRAHRNRPQQVVEDVHPGVGQGPSYRRRRLGAGPLVQPGGGRPYSRLGGPVEVADRTQASQPGGGVRAQRLASDQHVQRRQRGAVVVLGAQQVLPQGGGGLHMGRLAADQQLAQSPGIAYHLTRRDHCPCAGQQGQVQLQRGDVEGDRGDSDHPVGRGRCEPGVHVLQEVGQGEMRDGDPLGRPGGAGGVDHVRRVGGIDGAAAVGVGHVVVGAPGHRAPRRLMVEEHPLWAGTGEPLV